MQGDPLSLEWLVVHFTPLLRLQARVRMPDALRRTTEPDDVVQEVWAITLPRLGDLHPRAGRLTPVLLKFMGTVILRRINNLMVRAIRTAGGAGGSDADGTPSVRELPASVTGALDRVLRGEQAEALEQAIGKLGPDDQELLVLRGIEQQPNKEVATRLGIQPGACAMRYHRVLETLRREVPKSLLDELSEAG